MRKSRLAFGLMAMIKRREPRRNLILFHLRSFGAHVGFGVAKDWLRVAAAELSANLINTLFAARPFTWTTIIYLN